MSPSAPVDESQPCECKAGPMHEEYPEHTIREHGIFNAGSDSGWGQARGEVLQAMPDQHDRITEALG